MTNSFIAYAESPIQVQEIKCYIEEFCVPLTCIYIFIGDSELKNKQIRNAAFKCEFENVIEFKYQRNAASKIVSTLNLFKQIKKHKGANVAGYLFGEYRSFFARFIGVLLNANKNILVDDGMATFYMHESFFSKGKDFECVKFRYQKLIIDLFFIKNKSLSMASEIQLYSNCEFKRPPFSIKKKKVLRNVQKNEDVIFVGGDYSELGIISLSDEMKLIVLTKNKFGKIKYFQHRSDSNEKLKLIRDNNIEIVTLLEPIENYFFNLEIYPKHVVGLYSSALLNLSLSYDINFFSINILDLISDMDLKEAIGTTYKYYNNINTISVVSYHGDFFD